ncbi:MAG: hypothetical protein Q6361_08210 [Candidatus Hermodarchaeota archaeon]|nr:hypothetical protein [Candidatus Hermodarchaeota archaeon]
MRSITAILMFGLGGAFLVVAIALAITDAFHGMIGAPLAYGALFGFLAFFLIGAGLSVLVEPEEPRKEVNVS